MLGSLFLAQHRAGQLDAGGHVIGRFHSLQEAQHALDACYAPQAWQGIRDETSGQRWWRSDGGTDWTETTSTRDTRHAR